MREQENKIRLITIEEASEMLNIKISRLRQAIFKREVNYIKLGALVRFKLTHLIDWVDRQTVKSVCLSSVI